MRKNFIVFFAMILFIFAIVSAIVTVVIGVSEIVGYTKKFGLFFHFLSIFCISAFLLGKINSKKVYI